MEKDELSRKTEKFVAANLQLSAHTMEGWQGQYALMENSTHPSMNIHGSSSYRLFEHMEKFSCAGG